MMPVSIRESEEVRVVSLYNLDSDRPKQDQVVDNSNRERLAVGAVL